MKLELTRGNPWRAETGGIARVLVIAAGTIAIAVVAYLLLRGRPEPAAEPRQAASESTPIPEASTPAAATDVTTPPTPPPIATTTSAKPGAKTSSPAASAALQVLPRGEPTAASRQVVSALTQIDLSSGNITPVQAAVFKESLRALVGQGEEAVPAIREFLEKNLDLNFSSLENGGAMGASSLRMALLNAMQEIGGAQAIAGSLQTLQTSADPAELALMAAYLQKADPAQYRDSVLAAAHEALSMAATGKWDGRDVAPLFDVLKTFGGEEAARDLEKYANTWFNYTPLVLAELPDGAGIASLIRLNTDGAVSLGKETYQRMLAQVSTQSPEATAALVQLAQSGKIDPSTWRSVADALTGITLQLAQSPVSGSTSASPSNKSFHVAIGNQNFVEQPAPANMTAEQLNQRIGLIDQLLAVTSNPSAVTYLQQARGSLVARL